MTDEILHDLVPPFHSGKFEPTEPVYCWWSWHPRYPYWSKSCWEGTYEKAMAYWNEGHVGRIYHAKLIKDYEGKFTEVEDKPCERLDCWRKCIEVDNNLEELQNKKAKILISPYVKVNN